MPRKKLFLDSDCQGDGQAICLRCLDDPFFEMAYRDHDPAHCIVCEKSESPTVGAKLLAKMVRERIARHFDVYRKGLPEQLTLPQVISRMFGSANSRFCDTVASLVATQITSSKNDNVAGRNQKYCERRQEEPNGWWNAVALSLTHRQRHFNDEAERFFRLLFDEATGTKHGTLFGNIPAIVKELNPGFPLYRARRAASPEERMKIIEEPARELGAPPKEVATQNRMSSSGIPLFYAAVDPATCIAEVRPSIGDEIVVGKFKLTKKLRFFDFRGLDPAYPKVHPKLSYFWDDYEARKRCRAFLSYLSNTISQPIRDDGSGYVVTQAMAEYLCHKYEQNFDGIIFKSVQAGHGANYVIFSEKTSAREMLAPTWQASFPVEHVDKPRVHRVISLEYTCTPPTDS